ncbi:MAG: NADH-quinone oxidoreductase subunit B [gamma proteobacterium symbiont of Ctena orbiculata]|nr:MAG: NADH-quinone oxidoreductase subunit B [gamma proteobacterium symbiont of Ctena orbiculata]
MSSIEIWILLLLAVMMLSAAMMVLLVKNHIAAVAAASVVSLGLALLFVLMRAPDVAMTEAAVGVGLSSLILALALRRLGLWQVDNEQVKYNLLSRDGENEDE